MRTPWRRQTEGKESRRVLTWMSVSPVEQGLMTRREDQLSDLAARHSQQGSRVRLDSLPQPVEPARSRCLAEGQTTSASTVAQSPPAPPAEALVQTPPAPDHDPTSVSASALADVLAHRLSSDSILAQHHPLQRGFPARFHGRPSCHLAQSLKLRQSPLALLAA